MQFCRTKEGGKEDHKQKKDGQEADIMAQGKWWKTLQNLEWRIQKFCGKQCREQPKTHCKSTACGSAQPLHVLWVACGSFQVAATLPVQQLLWIILVCSKSHLSGDGACTYALGKGSIAAIIGTHREAQKYLLNWGRHQCHSINPKQAALHTYTRLIFSMCKTAMVALET